MSVVVENTWPLPHAQYWVLNGYLEVKYISSYTSVLYDFIKLNYVKTLNCTRIAWLYSFLVFVISRSICNGTSTYMPVSRKHAASNTAWQFHWKHKALYENLFTVESILKVLQQAHFTVVLNKIYRSGNFQCRVIQVKVQMGPTFRLKFSRNWIDDDRYINNGRIWETWEYNLGQNIFGCTLL